MKAPWLEDEALCTQVDPDLWFPSRGGDVSAAKRVCHHCPIEAECLEYAVADPALAGVWGGTSDRARRTLRAQRSSTSSVEVAA